MEKKVARKSALILVSTILTLGILTYVISFVIRGYRPDINKKQLGILPTGLLVASSDPKGASVYINDKLATATDDTISLSPDEYSVKIEKDGYLAWQKNLTIQKEVVTQTNTTLFRNAPDLKPLTNTGAINPTLSPSGTKIIYGVEDASTNQKNGIWMLELGSTLPISRASVKQLTEPIPNLNWEETVFDWSPDSKSVILTSRKEGKTTHAYLISTDKFTPLDQLTDISFRITLIKEEWKQEEQENFELDLAKLPKEISKIASESAKLVTFSPDNEKFFYQAKESLEIPENIIPHPPARSTQKESRKIEKDNIYVYDLEEDTNFYIGSAEELGLNSENNEVNLHWLTDNHLIYIGQEKKEVKVIETDATNNQTIYAGPFENGFVFPSPSGKSLIVLTSLHPDSPGNLYEIRVR